MLDIVYRLAHSKLVCAWAGNDIHVDIINPVDEGVDAESSGTHHDLDHDDFDLTTIEPIEPLQLELPSHKL
jgi:hypothetical protein